MLASYLKCIASASLVGVALFAGGCGDSAEAEPVWGAVELIGQSAGASSGYLSLHADPDDNVIATWLGSGQLWTNIRVGGVGWGDAEPLALNQANDRPVTNLRASVLETGTVLVVWSQSTDVMAARYQAGVGWTGPTKISTESAFSPRLATDLHGNGLAAWSKRNSIWASRYTSDGEWSPPELVASNDEGEAIRPQVAMDSDGRSQVVWLTSFWPASNGVYIDGGEVFDLEGRGYSSDAAWDPVESLGGCGHLGPCAFGLATGTRGVARLAWWTAGQLATRHFAPDSGWSDTTDLIEEGLYPEAKVYGDAGITWTDANGIQGWDSPSLEALEGGPIDRLPNIGFGPEGFAHAVWLRDGAILASRYRPGAGWRDPVVLEEHGSRDVTFPQIVVDESGHATAAWLLRIAAQGDTVRTARLE